MEARPWRTGPHAPHRTAPRRRRADMTEVDVVVIGAGPAGEVAAGRLADGGLSVALVERELIGGECSYWACIPSKTLLRPGDILAEARRVPGAAEAVAGPNDGAGPPQPPGHHKASWGEPRPGPAAAGDP